MNLVRVHRSASPAGRDIAARRRGAAMKQRIATDQRRTIERRDSSSQAARGQGDALAAPSQARSTCVDLGAQIQAGLGVTVDDVPASEVVLVTMMPDDSRLDPRRAATPRPCATATTSCSTRSRGSQAVATRSSRTRATSTATCCTRTARSSSAVRMTAQNYDPNLGTPLYDQTRRAARHGDREDAGVRAGRRRRCAR